MHRVPLPPILFQNSLPPATALASALSFRTKQADVVVIFPFHSLRNGRPAMRTLRPPRFLN